MTTTTATTATRTKSKNGGLSVIRIGLIAGAIGVALIIVGVLIFLNDQAARRVPFGIEPYAGANEWGTADATAFSRSLLYRVPGAVPDEVAAYYQDKLDQHNGDSSEQCVRVPPTGSMPTDPNNPLSIPYEYRCMFDNSGFQTTQYTQVLIYPGAGSSQGMTVIEYEQRWTP